MVETYLVGTRHTGGRAGRAPAGRTGRTGSTTMYNNVQQCTTMYSNVQQCMTLHGDVQQCTSLYGIVHHHIGVAQKRIQRYSTTPYRHGIMTTVDQIADQSTNKR